MHNPSMVTIPTTPPSLDPLVRLPYEIGIECLIYAIHGWNLAFGPLPYMAISSHWCKTILGSPPLWHNIVIDGGEDERARVETFLLLSGDYPIDVDIEVSEECSESLESLLNHKWRIRSLAVGWLDTNKAQRLIGNGIFPSLKRLEYKHPILLEPRSEIDTAFMSACPQLRILQGRTVSIEEAASLPPGMRCVSLRITDNGNLSAFLANSALQILRIRVEEDRREQPEQPDDKALERWAKSLQNISKHTSIHLRGLMVHCSLSQALTLLSHLPSLPGLQTLQIEVDVENVREEPTQFLLPSADIATRAKIYFLDIRWHGYAVEQSDRELQKFAHLLCKNIAIKHLLGVHISTGAQVAWLFSLLRSACNLKALRLHGPYKLRREEEGPDPEPIVMDKLIVLSATSPDIMPFIYAPNLRSLEIMSHDEKIVAFPAFTKNIGRTLARLTVPSHLLDVTQSSLSSEAFVAALPDVQSLTLIGSVPCRTVMHLTSVHLVSFEDGTTQATREPLNAFLLSLLRNPHALPRLNTLESDAFPLWGLLFEVVHSRFYTASVSAIARVLFPSYPALSILSALVRSLQGNAHLRYSHHFDDIIRESASKLPRTACLTCIVAGHVQCSKQSPPDSDDSMEPFMSLYKKEISSGAVNSTNLETWEERVERDKFPWVEMTGHGVTFWGWCYRKGRQVEITLDTLYGLL